MVWLNPARKLLAGCIAFCDSDSCAKLFADGVAKSCAKPSKPISRNHCPTRHTSPSAKREAQSLALHCSLQSAKLCEMGLCAPCRGAPAVVLRFSCQRSSVAVPLEARRLGADWLVPSFGFRGSGFGLCALNSQLSTLNSQLPNHTPST